MGDPNEYLRVLGSSINSSGFTDKQLAIQMDTIQRKAQTLKASFEELLVTGGNESGFRNSLKSILDTLNQVLKGLNNINPVVWETVGNITKFALAFVALRTAVNFASSSYTLLRTTIVSTTAAQEALNVATTVNPWGALAKLIVLAGTALATYAYFAGEAVTAQEKANQAADNAITAKSSEIEMTKQQTSYMETLGNTYVSLQDALVQVGNNEEKAAEIKKTMGTVSQQLAQIVGQEAADRILASNDIMGAITQEQEVHNEKTAKMQQELDALRATQVKLANDTISMCNERIGAINAEAEAFDKAADAIGQALGKIDEIMFKHLRNKANYLNNLANGDIRNEWKIAGIPVPEDQDISGVTQQISNEAAEANRQADEIKENALNYWAEKGRVALGKIYTPGNYNTTPITTGDISEDTGNQKAKHDRTGTGGTGSRYAPDKTDEIEKLWANHNVNQMLSDAKIKATEYQTELEKLNTQQELFGVSADTAAKKIQLMTSRMQELTTEDTAMESLQKHYEDQANSIIAANETLVNALKEKQTTFAQLSKEEKSDFVHAYSNYFQDEKLMLRLLDLSDKLKTEIANNKKEISSLGNGIQKEQFKTPEQLYNKKMQNIDLDEQHSILSLGYNATDAAKKVEELKFAIQKLTEAQARLKEIENTPSHNVDDLKRQQVEVDKLKNKVDELSNSDMDKLNKQFADMIVDWAVEGRSFHDIWKQIWKDFQKDAIYSILGVKHEASFLGQLLGNLFGGRSSAGTTPTATTGVISDFPMVAHSGENITSVAPKMHDGGLVNTNQLKDDEVLRTLQVGERVLSKDQNEFFTSMVSRFNNHEAFKGVQVEPYLKNPELAKAATVNVQVQQQNDHIKELEKQTQLLQTVVGALANNQGNNGNVTVVATQVSADQVLQVLQQNPSALNDILGRNRSIGYR